MLNRRKFFKASMSEMADAIDEFREASSYTLSEVFDLTDAQLGTLRPLIFPEVVLEEREGMIIGFTLEDDEGVPLFEHSPLNNHIVHAFDGHTSITRIAHQLAGEYGLAKQEAFELVKEMFFLLIKQSMCVPGKG